MSARKKCRNKIIPEDETLSEKKYYFSGKWYPVGTVTNTAVFLFFSPHLFGYDCGLDHVSEPSDAGVHVLRIDDVLLLVEGDSDPTLLLLPLVLRDAEHRDPTVRRSVELGQVVQLRLSLGQAWKNIKMQNILGTPQSHCTALFTGKSVASIKTSYPTGLFPVFEPQYQGIGEFYVVHERRATDFEARKLWKGRSGNPVRAICIAIIFSDFYFPRKLGCANLMQLKHSSEYISQLNDA